MTRELVDRPAAALEVLLREQAKQEEAVLAEVVHEFSRRFRESFGLTLNFSKEAIEQLVAGASQQRKTVRDFCGEKLKDFQFGLKLISQNTGRTEFTIDAAVIENPEKVLSEWVVASYRGAGQGQGKVSSDE